MKVLVDADVSVGLSVPKLDIFRTGTEITALWRVWEISTLGIFGPVSRRGQSPDCPRWRIHGPILPLRLQVSLLDAKKMQESLQPPLVLVAELFDQVVQLAGFVEDIVSHVDVPEDCQLLSLDSLQCEFYKLIGQELV